MKAAQILGIILAIALIIFAIAFPMPEKHLRTSSYSYNSPWTDDSGEEYVGGDAYNYQMEASLKGGYMSGILAMKSITLVGGLLLLFLSLFSGIKCAAIENQTQSISELMHVYDKHKALLEDIAAKIDDQNSIIRERIETMSETKCIEDNDVDIEAN